MDLVDRSVMGSAALLPAGGRSTIVLRGVVDVRLTPELARVISRAADAGLPVDVDASGVSTIDTAAAASLAWLAASCAGQVRLLGATDAVRAVLDSTGVAELLS